MTLEEISTKADEMGMRRHGYGVGDALHFIAALARELANTKQELQATRTELEDVKRRIATKATTF